MGDRKIASIGVSVRDWVTCHGVALNVAVRAEHFAMIHPCGLPIRVVSMNDVLATPAAWSDVESALAAEIGLLLGRRWIEVTWSGWEASLG
jgi:lipoyl(octanoyl) transferase